MDDPALEAVHARPFGGVAFRVAVVTLAHPEEAGGEARGLAVVGADSLDGPQVVGAGPDGAGDGVAIADVVVEIVLLDHLAHVFQDLFGAGDGRAGPGLEAVAEGVEVAVGADAGILVGAPGAAKGFLGLQDHEALAGALGLQVIGAADAGDAGAHDEDVEVLGPGRRGALQSGRVGHLRSFSPAIVLVG